MSKVTIRIPTPLRKFAGDQASVEVDAGTIQGAVDALVERYGDLSNQILGDDGKVRRFVNVYLNDEDIRFLDSFETPVEEGDEISIIPAIAGGGS